MSRMNASERQALRQVVRQRMKVLRADVAARRAELDADLQQRVTDRFAQRDKLVRDLNDQVADIVDQANKDIRAAVEQVERDFDLTLRCEGRCPAPLISADNRDRLQMARQLAAEIEAQVNAALVQIDRQEADLIEELTLDGLTTDAAKQFLGCIPTVGALVPAARMREIAG